MLVNLKTILKFAEAHACAVGSFNTPGLEALSAVIGAAEALELPVIVQHAECHETIAPLAMIGPAMLQAAERATVPVCVHLDHGETLAYLARALKLGFTSIMYDGSTVSYEENVENTQKAAAMAREAGASLEAELGSMGRRESGSGDHTGAEDETKIYTDPKLAGEFVRATGVDALACSFGTTHGIYLTAPRLDFGVVRAVRREAGGIPVVMHGGSGVSAADFHAAIAAGVRKVNYFTYMDKAGGTAAAEWVQKLPDSRPFFFTEIAAAAQRAMQENVTAAMKMFALQDC